MELDHVFVFAGPDDPEVAYLKSIGLTANARRRHLGQGTENICFYFENMFLECLWVHGVSEVRAPAVGRTKLYERSRWRTDGTNPFGLAWRDAAGTTPASIEVWGYKPPYVPPGDAIDVAVDSDDPRQPMVFRSPGTLPPAQWPDAKRGVLQAPAGLGRVVKVELQMPSGVGFGPALASLAAATILNVVAGERFSLSLEIEKRTAGSPIVVTLPIYEA